MATRDLDAVFYVRHLPDIRYEGGMFFIGFDVGQRARFEFVLTPNLFLKTRKSSEAALGKFHAGESDPVGIKRSH